MREAEALGYGTGTELYPFEAELGLDNVISPVGNLTVRQRILYELAVQEVDGAARQRARAELENAGLNPTQAAQLRALLDGESARAALPGPHGRRRGWAGHGSAGECRGVRRPECATAGPAVAPAGGNERNSRESMERWTRPEDVRRVSRMKAAKRLNGA